MASIATLAKAPRVMAASSAGHSWRRADVMGDCLGVRAVRNMVDLPLRSGGVINLGDDDARAAGPDAVPLVTNHRSQIVQESLAGSRHAAARRRFMSIQAFNR